LTRPGVQSATPSRCFFSDGSASDNLIVEYPIGHPRRRQEGLPHLRRKFETNLLRRLPPKRAESLLNLFADPVRLDGRPAHEFVDLLVP
jgi:2-methylcitrate dehydratase